MTDTDVIESIRSKMTLVQWHLEQFRESTRETTSYHLNAAQHVYASAVDLLPSLKVSGKRRVELVSELAKLADRLLEAGARI